MLCCIRHYNYKFVSIFKLFFLFWCQVICGWSLNWVWRRNRPGLSIPSGTVSSLQFRHYYYTIFYSAHVVSRKVHCTDTAAYSSLVKECFVFLLSGPVAPYLLHAAGLQNTVVQRIHYGTIPRRFDFTAALLSDNFSMNFLLLLLLLNRFRLEEMDGWSSS